MKNDAYQKLIWTLVLFSLFTFFTINTWYIEKKLIDPKDGIRKQISDTQDEIKSLNSELSKWKNESNMTLEAKKLNLRKKVDGEVVILEKENDS
jgi:F0F1-type ATP synthase membrane subunit b/b'